MISIQANVSNARRRYEAKYAFYHSKPRPQNRNERQLLAHDTLNTCRLKWSFHLSFFERQGTRRLIRHQHSDFVHEFLEVLCGGPPITQNGQFVLNQWVADHDQAGQIGGGVHSWQASIFAS